MSALRITAELRAAVDTYRAAWRLWQRNGDDLARDAYLAAACALAAHADHGVMRADIDASAREIERRAWLAEHGALEAAEELRDEMARNGGA